MRTNRKRITIGVLLITVSLVAVGWAFGSFTPFNHKLRLGGRLIEEDKDLFDIGTILGTAEAKLFEVLPNENKALLPADVSAVESLLARIGFGDATGFASDLRSWTSSLGHRPPMDSIGSALGSIMAHRDLLFAFARKHFGPTGLSCYVLGDAIPSLLRSAWYFEAGENLRLHGAFNAHEDSITSVYVDMYRLEQAKGPIYEYLQTLTRGDALPDGIRRWTADLSTTDLTRPADRDRFYVAVKNISVIFGVGIPTARDWPPPLVRHRIATFGQPTGSEEMHGSGYQSTTKDSALLGRLRASSAGGRIVLARPESLSFRLGLAVGQLTSLPGVALIDDVRNPAAAHYIESIRMTLDELGTANRAELCSKAARAWADRDQSLLGLQGQVMRSVSQQHGFGALTMYDIGVLVGQLTLAGLYLDVIDVAATDTTGADGRRRALLAQCRPDELSLCASLQHAIKECATGVLVGTQIRADIDTITRMDMSNAEARVEARIASFDLSQLLGYDLATDQVWFSSILHHHHW